MGIDLFVKDERGNVLASLPDTGVFADLSTLMCRQSGSCCLRFIDPAGDTCFNQLQRPVLLEEFRQLLPSISNARAKDHISKIADLLRDATNAHVYFWFVGD
jgi:hypothetical protein